MSAWLTPALTAIVVVSVTQIGNLYLARWNARRIAAREEQTDAHTAVRDARADERADETEMVSNLRAMIENWRNTATDALERAKVSYQRQEAMEARLDLEQAKVAALSEHVRALEDVHEIAQEKITLLEREAGIATAKIAALESHNRLLIARVAALEPDGAPPLRGDG